MTIFSPHTVATLATRTSTSLPSIDRRELAVLWASPLLHDVHPAHDLEAARQCCVHAHWKGERDHEMAVDAEPNTDVFVLWLDVDVAGTVAHGLADNAAHELDDRRLIVEADLGGNGSNFRLVVDYFKAGDQSADVCVGAVDEVDERANRGRVGDVELDRSVGSPLNCSAAGRRRIAAQHDQRGAFFCDRDSAVATNDKLVKHALDLVGDDDALGVNCRYAGGGRDGHGQFVTASAITTQHDVAELQQVAIGLRQGGGKVFCRDLAALN